MSYLLNLPLYFETSSIFGKLVGGIVKNSL